MTVCRVDAADGSAELCRMATELTGIQVKQMLFEELSTVEQYDGIWACASILHLPRKELGGILQKISDALKPGSVLYSSFKYGDFEGIRRGRYFTDLTEDSLAGLMAEVPSLQIVETWITNDVRPGREEERWINILARRI
jgi:SAM-dependent methyltransferase